MQGQRQGHKKHQKKNTVGCVTGIGNWNQDALL
jgi:hypothetical protein